jgi:hypothetical protein
MRFSADSMSGMRVSAFGCLRFETEFESHEFDVGMRNKRLLKDGLAKVALDR